MKKLLKIIAIILLVLFVAIAGLMSQMRTKCGNNESMLDVMVAKIFTAKCAEPLTSILPEWLACASDADCTVIQGFCTWEPIRKDSAAAGESVLQQKYSLDRIEYDCPQTFKDTPRPTAKCVTNRCTSEVTH